MNQFLTYGLLFLWFLGCGFIGAVCGFWLFRKRQPHSAEWEPLAKDERKELDGHERQLQMRYEAGEVYEADYNRLMGIIQGLRDKQQA